MPGSAAAAQLGPLVAVSPGPSPFASCTADDLAPSKPCARRRAVLNYPNTEIEPWVDANPTNPRT